MRLKPRILRVPSIEIIQPGALTTVQDLGRAGWGRLGICRSGAMDPWALRLANLLVGNAEMASALEITGPGARLRFFGNALICVVGADLGAQLDGEPLAVGESRLTRDRQILAFTERRCGFRALLAARGGIQVHSRLGSRATDMATSWPRGRLQANEMLEIQPTEGPFARPQHDRLGAAAMDELIHELGAAPGPTPELGFVPQACDAAIWLLAQTFRVSSRSNRTGFRLDPQVPCPVPATRATWSEPVAPGTIQLPPDGHPILLLADAPSLGGYPVIGHLASVEHSRAAHVAPGDEVRFRQVTIAQAQAMAKRKEALLERVARSLSRLPSPDTP